MHSPTDSTTYGHSRPVIRRIESNSMLQMSYWVMVNVSFQVRWRMAWLAYLRVYIWIGWLAKLWRDCISDKNKVHLRTRDALHSLQVDHEVVVVFGCGVTLDGIKYPWWLFILLQCISWEFDLCRINSLAPGWFKVNFRRIIFKLILVVNGWGISCETTLIWLSLDHTYLMISQHWFR